MLVGSPARAYRSPGPVSGRKRARSALYAVCVGLFVGAIHGMPPGTPCGRPGRVEGSACEIGLEIRESVQPSRRDKGGQPRVLTLGKGGAPQRIGPQRSANR